MKYTYAAAAAAIALAGAVAVAQTTGTPPAAPVGPVAASTCPTYPTPPTMPAAEAIRNQKELNAATEIANAYINQFNAIQQCRVPEAQRLEAQYKARVDEAKAGQEQVRIFSESWKATGEAVVARGAKKDPRSGLSGGAKKN